MKSIKSKIQISMLSVVLIGSVLIGVITALLNAGGIDDVMTKTLGPAISQVTEGISQISGVVQNTSATSEQSAATAQDLSNQSRLMNELVRRFQLN